jgi:hypothetical protein
VAGDVVIGCFAVRAVEKKSERGGCSGQRLQGLEMGRLKDNARGVCCLCARRDKCLNSYATADELIIYVSLAAILSSVCMHLRLLATTKHLRCADQRHRVYALLSVATTGHEGILADYTVQIASLIYHVLDNMCKDNEPKNQNDAIARCLDLAEVFQADL